MPLIDRVNLITVFLIGVFLLPIAAGMLRPLTYERIYASVSTVISAALAAVSAAGAVWFTECLYSNGGNNPLGWLFKGIPAVWCSIASQDVLIYFLIVFILMLGLNGGLQLLMIPFNRKILNPLSVKLGGAVATMNRAAARIVGGLWQLPKAVWLVLIFALLFNFYSLVTNNDALNGYIRNSSAFRLIDRAAVQPIISSGAARQIPEFIDSTVDKAVNCLSPEGRKMLIKVYINGVTVDDAITSSPEIDNTAIDLVDAENDRYVMAERLYRWICENISYDHVKAESLKTDAFAMPSGAVPAFSGMTGVCFDKACLYVAMCRAVGVRVRLITGEGFNGREWIDHSWNQIYSDRDRRWVNVDPTFGTGDKSYFDNPDFNSDHREGEIQGEW